VTLLERFRLFATPISADVAVCSLSRARDPGVGRSAGGPSGDLGGSIDGSHSERLHIGRGVEALRPTGREVQIIVVTRSCRGNVSLLSQEA